jgi:hypothetical protein
MKLVAQTVSSAEGAVRRDVVYVHHVSVHGTCTKCGNSFNVAFTKEQPNGSFLPTPKFECPCGHFSYDPVDHTVTTSPTVLTRDELRTKYDLATRQRTA